MSKTHRVRKCKDCSKQLGSTLVRCFECGGEKPGESHTDLWGPVWKFMLGVEDEYVWKYHDKSRYTDLRA